MHHASQIELWLDVQYVVPQEANKEWSMQFHRLVRANRNQSSLLVHIRAHFFKSDSMTISPSKDPSNSFNEVGHFEVFDILSLGSMNSLKVECI